MSLVRRCDRCGRDLIVMVHRIKHTVTTVRDAQKPHHVLPKHMEVCTECAGDLRTWSETKPLDMPIPPRKVVAVCDICHKIAGVCHFVPFVSDQRKNRIICADCYNGECYAEEPQ